MGRSRRIQSCRVASLSETARLWCGAFLIPFLWVLLGCPARSVTREPWDRWWILTWRVLLARREEGGLGEPARMLRPAFVSWRVAIFDGGIFEESHSNDARSQAFASLGWRSCRAVVMFAIWTDRWQRKYGADLTLPIIYLRCLAECFENYLDEPYSLLGLHSAKWHQFSLAIKSLWVSPQFWRQECEAAWGERN
jgi:hypothetical protein